jgi:hypothetical protein
VRATRSEAFSPRATGSGVDEVLQRSAAVKPATVPDAPGVKEIRERLAAAGYDVAPRAPEGVALAAERARHPGRVLVFAPTRLDLAAATQVLDKAKRLDADIAFVVCEEADQDAKERFIATRGRWVAPDAVPSLVLA